PLEIGSNVEVRFQMPEEIVSGQTHEWTFTARVIHREQLGRLGNKFGVGVYFLYYSAHQTQPGISVFPLCNPLLRASMSSAQALLTLLTWLDNPCSPSHFLRKTCSGRSR